MGLVINEKYGHKLPPVIFTITKIVQDLTCKEIFTAITIITAWYMAKFKELDVFGDNSLGSKSKNLDIVYYYRIILII